MHKSHVLKRKLSRHSIFTETETMQRNVRHQSTLIHHAGKKMRSFSVTTLAACAATTLLPAHADIKFTQEMRMPSQGNKAFSKTTIFRRAGAERVETSYQFGAAEQRSVTLTLCAKKEMYNLDPALKIYYAMPLVKVAKAASASKGATKTGSMTMTLVSLKDVGAETVGGTKARCYEVVTRMQTSGCLGNMDTTSKQHLCMAAATNLGSDVGCTDMMPGSSGSAGNECKTSYIRKGDWSRYEKLLRGLQVRTRTFSGATSKIVQSEIQTSGISRAKLPGSLFALPADYRRVSSTEFQQAQSRAMMEKLAAQKTSE